MLHNSSSDDALSGASSTGEEMFLFDLPPASTAAAPPSVKSSSHQHKEVVDSAENNNLVSPKLPNNSTYKTASQPTGTLQNVQSDAGITQPVIQPSSRSTVEGKEINETQDQVEEKTMSSTQKTETTSRVSLEEDSSTSDNVNPENSELSQSASNKTMSSEAAVRPTDELPIAEETTTPVSSEEEDGDYSYGGDYYEYDPALWEEVDAEQEQEYQKVLDELENKRLESKSNPILTRVRPTVSDIRFKAARDPITNRDLYLDVPPWNAQDNFISGSLGKTYLFPLAMISGLALGLVVWLCFNTVYKVFFRVRRSVREGKSKKMESPIEMVVESSDLRSQGQGQSIESTISLGGKQFNVSSSGVPYYNSCYAATGGSSSTTTASSDGASSWRSSATPTPRPVAAAAAAVLCSGEEEEIQVAEDQFHSIHDESLPSSVSGHTISNQDRPRSGQI